eukprot:SAG22_NODE_166_length_16765_cov_30.782791_1_plen_83_part_00
MAVCRAASAGRSRAAAMDEHDAIVKAFEPIDPNETFENQFDQPQHSDESFSPMSGVGGVGGGGGLPVGRWLAKSCIRILLGH